MVLLILDSSNRDPTTADEQCVRGDRSPPLAIHRGFSQQREREAEQAHHQEAITAVEGLHVPLAREQKAEYPEHLLPG
jgi:hypothetical protein